MSKKFNNAHRLEGVSRSIFEWLDHQRLAINARKVTKKQLAAMNGGLNGSTKQYVTEVLPFWSKYNLKPRKMWYDLYGYVDQTYNPYYIPEDIYWQEIYPRCNKVSFRQAYTDKNFYDRLFPNLRKPKTHIKNSNHSFYDTNGNLIDRDTAIEMLNELDEFVIKPAIYSGEGVDIIFYQKDKSNLSVTDLLKLYKSNYVIQEVAKQHETLKKIHPESLNTIRLISFIYAGEVHISSAILRMGMNQSRLDNFSTGGIAAKILENGQLASKGINNKGEWLTSHPNSGIRFSDITLPNYDKVIAAVKDAHAQTHHFRIIGWDFAIDQDGEPLFIEYNGAPGMNQISCGPLFGDLTPQVLDTLLLGKDEYTDKEVSYESISIRSR